MPDRRTCRVRSYTLATQNIEVLDNYDPALPLIHADQREIEQLVVNLFINAEQAVIEQCSTGRCQIAVETSSIGGYAVLRVPKKSSTY